VTDRAPDRDCDRAHGAAEGDVQAAAAHLSRALTVLDSADYNAPTLGELSRLLATREPIESVCLALRERQHRRECRDG
jgi:hypothetical protein